MPARTAWLVVAVTATALALTTTGCSSDGSDGQVPAAPRVTVDQLPAPAEEDVVLTVRGGATNGDDALVLSLEQVERLGTRDITVHEPFLDTEVQFTVVPWAALLELADLPEGVDVLHTVAYNEYEVDVPVAVVDEPGVWLATRQDGEPIAVADGGPTRIVFDEEHPDADDESLWIWSIALVEPA